MLLERSTEIKLVVVIRTWVRPGFVYILWRKDFRSPSKPTDGIKQSKKAFRIEEKAVQEQNI